MDTRNQRPVTVLEATPRTSRSFQRGEVARLRRGMADGLKQQAAVRRLATYSGLWKVIEIFAGIASVTYMAGKSSSWEPMQPVEVIYGDDLRVSKVRSDLLKHLQSEDPNLVVLSPPCGPWSKMQRRQPDQEAVRRKQNGDVIFWEFAAKVLNNLGTARPCSRSA